MRYMIKRVTALLLTVALVLTVMSGCSGKERRINFLYPFTANINSYDPQIAATSDEFLLIENTFEGLIRINDDGTVVPGCADSWEVSDDGLTYTFHLHKGLKWNINTDKYEEGEQKGEFKDRRLQMLGKEFNPDITAHDFVFALQRAAAPETQAPMFPSIASIENAVAVNSGAASPDKLGVTATDDYTLVITLSSKDDAFMQTLTSSIAMPCNEEFFNATKGRYGLELKYTLFNGQFYLSQLLDTSYLLKRNTYYTGTAPTVINQLTLKILTGDEDETGSKSVTGRLESGTYDAAFITGSQSAQLHKSSGITLIPYTDTTWALLLNTANPVFQSSNMRYAFCLGLSRTESEDSAYLQSASNLLPASCLIGNGSAAEKIGATVYRENREKSVSLWKAGLKDLESTTNTVTVLTTPEMEMPLKEMLQGIQAGIAAVVKDDDGNSVGLTVKVETMPLTDIDTAVAKREYDAVLYPFRSDSTSPIAFLKDITDNNKTGFDAATAEAALAKAETAETADDAAEYIRQAEQAVVDSFSVYPMLSETSYYASAKGVSGVQFHAGSGRVSFVAATRED